MKRVSVALALTALVVATVAIAQTAPERPADQPEKRTSAASDHSTSTTSDGSKQVLINVCVSQVQVSNPSVPEKDIKNFCVEQVNRLSRQN